MSRRGWAFLESKGYRLPKCRSRSVRVCCLVVEICIFVSFERKGSGFCFIGVMKVLHDFVFFSLETIRPDCFGKKIKKYTIKKGNQIGQPIRCFYARIFLALSIHSEPNLACFV